MCDTSNSELADNHDKQQDSQPAILDMSLEDILRLGLVSPFEDSHDDLSGDDAVDNEIGSGSSVWGGDPFGDELMSTNDGVDDETVSTDEDKPKQTDSSLTNVEQQQQLKEDDNILAGHQQVIEQYKKFLADHQQLTNQQADLIAKQAGQIRQLEERLSESWLQISEGEVDLLKRKTMLRRVDQLEHAYKHRNQASVSQSNVPLLFEPANIEVDLKALFYLVGHAYFRIPWAKKGFEIIYGLSVEEYGKRTGFTSMPEDIHQVFNKRANFNHLAWYKDASEKEQLASLKAICDTIIALWKGHVWQVMVHPTDEIKAKLAELEKMETAWEKDERYARQRDLEKTS